MKHLFVDLGLPQKYSYLHMTKKHVNNNTQFIASSIFSEKPQNIPDEAELLPIEKLIIDCDAENINRVNFNCLIVFHDKFNVPPFIEKMVGVIINKIFIRGKQFIENIRV
jgi:hypothetical protein